MPSADVITLLGEWEGYRVGTVGRFESGQLGASQKTPEVLIELLRGPGPFVYSGCGRSCARYHDWEERWVPAIAPTHRSADPPRFNHAPIAMELAILLACVAAQKHAAGMNTKINGAPSTGKVCTTAKSEAKTALPHRQGRNIVPHFFQLRRLG